MTQPISRRTFLYQAMLASGMMLTIPDKVYSASGMLITNVTGLYPVEVAKIISPSSVNDISAALSEWPGKVAIGGGRYSMGGQIAIQHGLHIDMRNMNQLVWLKPDQRRVRVQAGMCWRDLQDIIDPHGLAVYTMQSYSNFTIGGSISVNAHGRYVGHGPVCNSVSALQLILADGKIVETTPTSHPELFKAAIGGYGAIGVITEIELQLANNVRIERTIKEISLDDYVSFFNEHIKTDESCILHNADLIPPLFEQPIATTWHKTNKPLTEEERLIPRGKTYSVNQALLWSLTEIPSAENLHGSVIRPLRHSQPCIKWLNHEASLDVAELEPRSRKFSTYALQEYFIPPRHVPGFARAAVKILKKYDVDAVNISIRHSPADSISLLPWAKEEIFSFVLYYKQRTHTRARAKVGLWTRELVDTAISHQGRYYLPYQLHATLQQFNQAYPEAEKLRALKKKIDPKGVFSNSLWEKYL